MQEKPWDWISCGLLRECTPTNPRIASSSFGRCQQWGHRVVRISGHRKNLKTNRPQSFLAIATVVVDFDLQLPNYHLTHLPNSPSRTDSLTQNPRHKIRPRFSGLLRQELDWFGPLYRRRQKLNKSSGRWRSELSLQRSNRLLQFLNFTRRA